MDDLFEKDLLRRLDTIIKLLTISSMKDANQIEKIKLLSGAGFGSKEIADIIGTTVNTVSVAVSKMKNKSQKVESKANTSDLPQEISSGGEIKNA